VKREGGYTVLVNEGRLSVALSLACLLCDPTGRLASCISDFLISTHINIACVSAFSTCEGDTNKEASVYIYIYYLLNIGLW